MDHDKGRGVMAAIWWGSETGKASLCLLKKPFSVSRTGCSLRWLISTEYSLTMGFCFITGWHWRDFVKYTKQPSVTTLI